MSKIDVYNIKGEKTETIALPKEIFEVDSNPDLIHQIVVSQMSNKRQGTAHAKTISEVSGGGRKPWRQKGTGRARHGSIRSPIWRGGGVTFGPRNTKIFKKTVPKKMRRKALFMLFSIKAKEQNLIILDKIAFEQSKTSLAATCFNNLRTKIDYFEKGKVLVGLPEKDINTIRAISNLPDIKTIQAKDLNPLDLISSKYLILAKESIKVIKETFLK